MAEPAGAWLSGPAGLPADQLQRLLQGGVYVAVEMLLDKALKRKVAHLVGEDRGKIE